MRLFLKDTKVWKTETRGRGRSLRKVCVLVVDQDGLLPPYITARAGHIYNIPDDLASGFLADGSALELGPDGEPIHPDAPQEKPAESQDAVTTDAAETTEDANPSVLDPVVETVTEENDDA